jgi:hypothetical protein
MSAERSSNRVRAVEVTFFVASMCLLGWSVVLRLDPAATPRAANAQLLLSLGLALTTGAPLVARPRVRVLAMLTSAGVLALSIFQLVSG